MCLNARANMLSVTILNGVKMCVMAPLTLPQSASQCNLPKRARIKSQSYKHFFTIYFELFLPRKKRKIFKFLQLFFLMKQLQMLLHSANTFVAVAATREY
jgi:hypothetical protein